MIQANSTQQVLSPKELAHAIGVSESSIKRWIDEGRIAARKTAGGHRRIPLPDAIQFIRDSQTPLAHPELLGLPDIAAVAADLPAHEDQPARLLEYLREGHAGRARGLAMAVYLSGRSIAEICDSLIRPAMSELGEIWAHDSSGIFIEHRATDICIQIIEQFRQLHPDDVDGPVAVGGAVAGDPYFLPPLACAAVIASIGFATVNLGPDTPAKALAQAAQTHDACLVWLSVSSIPDAKALARDIRGLAEELTSSGISLALGGRVMDQLKIAPERGIHIGHSMAELAAFAKGLTLQHNSKQPTA